MKGIIKTNKGEMHISFYDNDAPATVANFVKLAKDGYYDGLKFHRVISKTNGDAEDFMIQGGCPNGNGSGGPGYTIQCEVSAPKQFHDRGVLSMAHAGRNTGGSQFFICHNRGGVAHLDGNHTCFGKVIEGIEIIDLIRSADAINSISIID